MSISYQIKKELCYIWVSLRTYMRIHDHKNGFGSVFTKKYKCTDLLYYEFYPTIEEAIKREKQLKKWKRDYKDELIKAFNPHMIDLFSEISEMQ